uniref:Tudor domain-containing protein n=1 Tax=Tetranychus urticae TaxID=32264 RepID=T1K841_TETUR
MFSSLKCELCSCDAYENCKVHCCFAVICQKCATGPACRKCNRPFDNSLDVITKKCNFFAHCQSLAVFRCSCSNRNLCDRDYYKTHQDSGVCCKDIISNVVQPKCDICKRFMVSYIGPSNLCTSCWMTVGDEQVGNYKEVKQNAIEKIDNLLDDCSSESAIQRNNILRYNVNQFEMIFTKLQNFKKEFISKFNNYADSNCFALPNSVVIPKDSVGLKIIKFGITNNQFIIDDTITKLADWKKINGNFNIAPLVKYKETADSNGFYKIEICVEMANCQNLGSIYNAEFNHGIVDLMSFQPRNSPPASVVMSSAESSLASSPRSGVYTNNSLVMLPCDEQVWFKTQLAFFRDPFWIYVVDPDRKESRKKILEILSKQQSFTPAGDINRGAQYIVKDVYRGLSTYKRAIVKGDRKTGIETIYVQFLDYGNKAWVAQSEIYEIPNSIHEILETVTQVKLVGISPISKSIFLQSEQEEMKDLIENNLKLLETNVDIKPIGKLKDNEGTFCELQVYIDGIAKDLSNLLVSFGFGSKHDGVFMPDKEYCYNWSFSNKKRSCGCHKSHRCSYCGQFHAVSRCSILKAKLNKRI